MTHRWQDLGAYCVPVTSWIAAGRRTTVGLPALVFHDETIARYKICSISIVVYQLWLIIDWLSCRLVAPIRSSFQFDARGMRNRNRSGKQSLVVFENPLPITCPAVSDHQRGIMAMPGQTVPWYFGPELMDDWHATTAFSIGSRRIWRCWKRIWVHIGGCASYSVWPRNASCSRLSNALLKRSRFEKKKGLATHCCCLLLLLL